MNDNDPKKSLGQHWLHDKNILHQIVVAADVSSGDQILEIGPGLGTLTDELLATGASVTALEFDPQLASNLALKYKVANNDEDSSQIKIVEGDIRKFDFSSLGSGYKIVANIPYYLTSHLVRQLCETPNKPARAVLLVQKEVAERICAKPGKMSILSVFAQSYFGCSLGVEVPAKFFTPPPKVDSQVVCLSSLVEAKVSEELSKKFIRVVKAGFSEKRKTLSNSLSGGLGIDKQVANLLLLKSGIDSTRRAQTLSINEWLKLVNNCTIELK